MPRLKRHGKPETDSRPVVTDDFIYDDPDNNGSQPEPVSSDTPDEAMRKLRGRSDAQKTDPAPESGPGASSESDHDTAGGTGKVYSSGIMLDDDLNPIGTTRKRSRGDHRILRGVLLTLLTLVLRFAVAAYIFHRLSPSTPVLGEPENVISRVMTPVQSFFSGLTEGVASYFRSMKLRSNIEAEYNALRAENEQLVYKAMLAEELQQTLSQYEDLSDEIKANSSMQPIICTVIGKSDSNYFSTFTINKGKNDGIDDYMAVTISGALVGYTENTQATKATVRTVIDSNASIAALIQSSRDQGTVRGTLGIDGTPMCRMYYLPDDNLPRPGDQVVTSGVGMSFPKGIPIGVVRESTRGMQANKQYIVLEPLADFQHLEYVIVLRYQPQPIAVEGRENGRTNVELVPMESARPSPVVPQIAASLFEDTDTTSVPSGYVSPAPEPEATPQLTPTATPVPSPSPVPTVYEEPIEYQVISPRGSDPTPSPTPTWEPTPTPYLTPDPGAMTFEEDD